MASQCGNLRVLCGRLFRDNFWCA